MSIKNTKITLGNSAIIAAGCLVLTLLFAIPAAFQIPKLSLKATLNEAKVGAGLAVVLGLAQIAAVGWFWKSAVAAACGRHRYPPRSEPR